MRKDYFQEWQQNLIKLRESKGLDVYQAAEKAGLNHRTIMGYEKGKIWPTKRGLNAIAKAYKTSIAKIMQVD